MELKGSFYFVGSPSVERKLCRPCYHTLVVTSAD